MVKQYPASESGGWSVFMPALGREREVASRKRLNQEPTEAGLAAALGIPGQAQFLPALRGPGPNAAAAARAADLAVAMAASTTALAVGETPAISAGTEAEANVDAFVQPAMRWCGGNTCGSSCMAAPPGQGPGDFHGGQDRAGDVRRHVERRAQPQAAREPRREEQGERGRAKKVVVKEAAVEKAAVEVANIEGEFTGDVEECARCGLRFLTAGWFNRHISSLVPIVRGNGRKAAQPAERAEAPCA